MRSAVFICEVNVSESSMTLRVNDRALGTTARSYLAAADEDRCCIVCSIGSRAEALDFRNKAVDTSSGLLKVFDKASRTIFFLFAVHGFRDAIGVKQKPGAGAECDGALWVRRHPETKRQAVI
jgi:hypothetical protein